MTLIDMLRPPHRQMAAANAQAPRQPRAHAPRPRSPQACAASASTCPSRRATAGRWCTPSRSAASTAPGAAGGCSNTRSTTPRSRSPPSSKTTRRSVRSTTTRSTTSRASCSAHTEPQRPAAAGHRAAAHARCHHPLHRGRGPRAEAGAARRSCTVAALVREDLARGLVFRFGGAARARTLGRGRRSLEPSQPRSRLARAFRH